MVGVVRVPRYSLADRFCGVSRIEPRANRQRGTEGEERGLRTHGIKVL